MNCILQGHKMHGNAGSNNIVVHLSGTITLKTRLQRVVEGLSSSFLP